MNIEAMQRVTLYDALVPRESWKVRLIQTMGLSLILGLISQIEFHLPFSPVPITAQTFGILTAAAILGRRWGVMCVLFYLAEGCAGLPFFAGGAWGPLQLVSPSGGYLLGFVPAAWIVGGLAERGWDRSPFKTVAMMALGSAAIFAVGVVSLARFVPAPRLLAFGVYPFLIGDFLKICLSAAALPAAWRFLGDQNRD